MNNTRDTLELILIRTGMTESGEQERYLGYKDEPLLDSEIQRLTQRRNQGVYPESTLIYTCGMERCRQTASCIYPRSPLLLTENFRPFDYGELEGKTYSEVVLQERYQEFLSRNARIAVPEGDAPFIYNAQVATGFRRMIEEIKLSGFSRAALITHGAALVSILRRQVLPRSLRQTPHVPYGGGVYVEYDLRVEGARIIDVF